MTLAMNAFHFPMYLTHGHYNRETDKIEACKTSNQKICDAIDFKGENEIWFFWSKASDIAKLSIQTITEKYEVDQRFPADPWQQWQKLSPDLIKNIADEIALEQSSLLSVSMTNIRFTDLVLGMQTLYFTFQSKSNDENQSVVDENIVPTIIHCYGTDAHRKCVWVF